MGGAGGDQEKQDEVRVDRRPIRSSYTDMKDGARQLVAILLRGGWLN